MVTVVAEITITTMKIPVFVIMRLPILTSVPVSMARRLPMPTSIPVSVIRRVPMLTLVPVSAAVLPVPDAPFVLAS